MKYNIYELNEENKLYSYRAKDHGDLLKEGLNLKEDTGFENDVWCSIEKLKHYSKSGKMLITVNRDTNTITLEPNDNIAYGKAQLMKETKPICRALLEKYDLEVLKHHDQLIEIKMGMSTETTMDDVAFREVIYLKKMYREMSNIAERMIAAIETQEQLDDAIKLMHRDFSNVKIAKAVYESIKNN